MNDFTKEELQDIDCLIRHAKRNGLELLNEKDSEDLEDKVNKLIDNYDKKPKPTIGLFGDETRNLIHKRMMDNVYENIEILESRIEKIESFLVID